jgi:hypothetical protein
VARINSIEEERIYTKISVAPNKKEEVKNKIATTTEKEIDSITSTMFR